VLEFADQVPASADEAAYAESGTRDTQTQSII
jgi:hypothetical protein